MKEKVYDAQISPLMAQIIAICEKNKIAFIADFHLDGDMSCMSAIFCSAPCSISMSIPIYSVREENRTMKEKVYDAQISPLMAQIIAICKKNKIAFIADFHLDGDMSCTSAILRDSDDPTPKQIEAFELLKPRQTFVMAVTEETLPDGKTRISMRRMS